MTSISNPLTLALWEVRLAELEGATQILPASWAEEALVTVFDEDMLE